MFSGLFIQRPNGLKSAFVFLEGNGTVGRESLLLDWERRRFLEQLRVVWGSLDATLPLRPEESPAPPVSRAGPWTPAAVVSRFRGWDSAWGRPPPPRGGFGTVASVEATAVTGRAAVTGGAAAGTGGAAAVTGGYGGGIMGPSGGGIPAR